MLQVMFSTVLLWIVTFYQPLKRSYYFEELAVKIAGSPLALAQACELDVPAEIGTFAGLLASRPGVLSFGQFLATEFSVENLYFVQAVEQLQRWKPSHQPPLIADDEADAAYEMQCVSEARAKAMEVYQKFVARNAPFEVNLSHSIAKKLHREFRPKPIGAGKPVGAGGGGGAASLQPPVITSRPNSGAGTPIPPGAGGGLLAPPQELKGTDVSPSLAASTAPPTAGGGANGSAGTVALPIAATASSGAAAGNGENAARSRPTSALGERSGGAVVGASPAATGDLLRRVASALNTLNHSGGGHVTVAMPEELALKLRQPKPAFGSVALPPHHPPTAVVGAVNNKPKSRDVSSVHAFGGGAAGGGGGGGAGEEGAKPVRTVAYYLSIFDAAHAAVYHLLESDSYSRYIASTAFERLVKSVTLAKKLAATSNDRSRDGAPKSTSNDGGGGGGGGGGGFGVQRKPTLITINQPEINETGAAYAVPAQPAPTLRTSSLLGGVPLITAASPTATGGGRKSSTGTSTTPVLTAHFSLTLSPATAGTPTNTTPKNGGGPTSTSPLAGAESTPLLPPPESGSGGAPFSVNGFRPSQIAPSSITTGGGVAVTTVATTANKPKRTVTKIVARTGSALTGSNGMLETSVARGIITQPQPPLMEMSVSAQPH